MKKVVETNQAPKAIGPYSPGIQVPAGTVTYFSGQIPIDPATGELVKGDITVQTERVMQNLKALVSAAGLSMGNLTRCGIFLVDMNDFAKVNEVYARYLEAPFPARSTVAVAALPRGARVEIEAIAVS